jgi:hypothetical protein
MEEIRSSETLIHTRSTRRHIPEVGIFHSHRRENLKSYNHFLFARVCFALFCFNAVEVFKNAPYFDLRLLIPF